MGIPLTLSSVPSTTPYIQYVATASQTVFPYPFPITQDSDLIVVVNGVTQATDSGYTLSGQGNSTGGSLTFTIGRTVGDIITLYRDITIERITQIGQNSGFSSTAFNNEYNSIYLILQQLNESIALSLQIPNTNNPAPVTTLLPANYANKYLSFDANGNPTPAALTSSGSLTQAIIAGLLIPQTAAESAAGVTPVNYNYPVCTVDRYATNTTPGTTDMTTACKNAYLVHVAGLPNGSPLMFLGDKYLVSDTIFSILTTHVGVNIQGIPFKTAIINNAAAAKPTVNITGTNFWSISGLAFVGNSGFPNDGIHIAKDAGTGNRSGFGKIKSCIFVPSGWGITISDTNTVDIDDIAYWPTNTGHALNFGQTANAGQQPGCILTSGAGAVNGINIRNINTSGLDTIANGGCMIKIDGTAGSAHQSITIDNLECERGTVSTYRAIWVRHGTDIKVNDSFISNEEIRVDNGSSNVVFDNATNGPVAFVIDGTQVGGGNSYTTLRNCTGYSLSADSANIYFVEDAFVCNGGGAYSNSSLYLWRRNTVSTAAYVPDQLGGSRAAFSFDPNVRTLAANGTIGAAGSHQYAGATWNSSSNVTGAILSTPGNSSGVAADNNYMQFATIFNVGSFSFTFAAPGTSNVAGGTAVSVAPSTQMTFQWNPTEALWYSMQAPFGGGTTGAQTATFTATNKPGIATTAPSIWLPYYSGGLLYYIPGFQ